MYYIKIVIYNIFYIIFKYILIFYFKYQNNVNLILKINKKNGNITKKKKGSKGAVV